MKMSHEFRDYTCFMCHVGRRIWLRYYFWFDSRKGQGQPNEVKFQNSNLSLKNDHLSFKFVSEFQTVQLHRLRELEMPKMRLRKGVISFTLFGYCTTKKIMLWNSVRLLPLYTCSLIKYITFFMDSKLEFYRHLFSENKSLELKGSK